MKNYLAIGNFVIIIIGIFSWISCLERVTPMLWIISGIIGFDTLLLSIKKLSVGKLVLSILYIFIVPIQYIFSIYWPQMIIAANYNKSYNSLLFADNKIMVEYFVYSLIFFAVTIIIIDIANRITLTLGPSKRARKIEEINENNPPTGTIRSFVKFPMFWLFVSFVVNYVLRQNAINGYLSYALYGWHLFNLASVVVSCTNMSSVYKKAARLLFASILYGAPTVVIGHRGDLVAAIIYIALYLFIAEREWVRKTLNEKKGIVILSALLFLILFGVSNLYKFGVFNPIGLLVSRFVGLFDGSSILKYLESNRVNLGLENFVMAAINDTGMRANRYYTRVIIGYPEWAQTGSAAPIFISSLLYGIIGMILLVIIYGFAYAIITKKAQLIATNMRYQIGNRQKNAYYLFILCNTIYIFFSAIYMDGNVEIIKYFCTPVAAALLCKLSQSFSKV